MKISNGKRLLIAVLAVTATAQAGTKSHSSSIVIDSPTDLPELAQRRSEAMYLYTNGSGQAFLYLEQDQGKSLAILDVSNAGSIREVWSRLRRCQTLRTFRPSDAILCYLPPRIIPALRLKTTNVRLLMFPIPPS